MWWKMKILKVGTLAMTLMLSSCLGKSHSGKVTVINKSSDTIANLEIKVPGKSMTFHNITPSAQVSDEYEVKSDGSFEITGTFQSGKKIQKNDGYITNGMDFDHEIVIGDSDISLQSKNAK
jgi:hypothetical protein